MDGYITIGTQLSTDKFDRQIVDLEKKMEKEENKKITIEVQLSKQEQELQRARAETDRLGDAYQRLKTIQDAIANNKATLSQFTDRIELQNTYGTLEQIGASLDKAISKQGTIEQKVEQTKSKYAEINNTISNYKQKIDNIKLQKHQKDVDNLKKSFNGVGGSIQNATKKISRLVLGIFEIRSAFMALRRASSELASYDEEYGANLEYIRFVLTQAIAPVLREIVNIVMQILKYVNAILQAWFGFNLLQNASVEDFENMKRKANGVTNAVKELKKQLAGFDEINILQDNQEVSSGGGGIALPTFDMSMGDAEKPEWLEWIIDNKDLILSILGGIGAALVAIKLGLSGIKALGVGIAFEGVLQTLKEFEKYLEDPTLKNAGGTFQGIGTAVAGIGVAIGSTTTAGVGAGILLYSTFIKYWDELKVGFEELIENIRKNWGTLGIYIGDAMQSIVDWIDIHVGFIKDSFDSFITFMKGIFAGDWDMVWQGIQNAFQSSWDFILNILGMFWQFLDRMVVTPIINVFNWLWEKFVSIFTAIWDWITTILDNFFLVYLVELEAFFQDKQKEQLYIMMCHI